jgi:hypothetical protein
MSVIFGTVQTLLTYKEIQNMSKWEEWKQAQGETKPWHMLDPNKYVENEELAAARFKICRECPELIKVTKQCKKCGCLMHLKTKLEAATCPIGKW